MKSIISSILVLTTLVQSSRLLQQTDTCGSFEEYKDCGSACPAVCGDSSIGPCIALCQPGCFCIDGYIRDSNGRCITDNECTASLTCANILCENKGEFCIEDALSGPRCTSCASTTCLSPYECVPGVGCELSICECNPGAGDCDAGYECLETPFGFKGCDENIGNSCFGFCSKQGLSCGGFAGLANCLDNEVCIAAPSGGLGTNTQPIGDCYDVQETCTPSPTVCGSIENCAVFSDGCNTCDCGVDGSATTPKCTEIACQNTVPYYCETCATGYEKDAKTGECVAIPTCGGDENYNCAAYSTGCSNCECAADGTVTCTNNNPCETDPITGEVIRCFPCDPLRGPYPCDACADGYYLDDSTLDNPGDCVEIPSCGGIDYCTSYNPDGCNTCSCGDRDFPICTLAFCPPEPGFQATCRACIDGFKPSADGLSCEEDLGCFCPLVFNPVCCDGVTYGNGCQASCAGCSGVITQGPCGASCAAILCPIGQKCVELGENGGKCVDEDVCCGEIENPGICREGCACCPDGTWSGSIGDGKTFCGGLVQGVDEFGTVCSTTVECQNKQDCDSGYKCKKDPICRTDKSINCGDVAKVCVNYQLSNTCSSDADCDANTGETCLLGLNKGICVNYQSP